MRLNQARPRVPDEVNLFCMCTLIEIYGEIPTS